MNLRWVFVGFAVVLLGAASGCSTKVADGAERVQGASAGANAFADTHAAEQAKPSAPDAMRAVPCATNDVKLTASGDNRDFDGMNHSGTYLKLTNRSRNACSVPGLPQLTFLDANGPVQTTADLPGAKFMHPGPVVLPIVLQPKQSVTTSARWVSGNVFNDNLCYKLTGVTLALRHESAMMPLVGQMCGERSQGVHYDLKRYGTDASAKTTPTTATK